MSQDIVSRLLSIDRRAEEVMARAKEEAEALHRETVKRTETARVELEERIAKGTAEAELREKEARKAKLAGLEGEFEAEVSRVRGTSPDAVARAVEKVVARAKGALK